jgi:hypothetical protein
MIATCSWPGRTGSTCVWARRQALTSRRLKRAASSGLSSAIACSFAPGVPKSLLRQPTAITSVS